MTSSRPAGRLGDCSAAAADAHGGNCCAHAVRGPATSGAGDVLINGRPALRRGDRGIHGTCCGPNNWIAVAGAATVLINHLPAHRLGDATRHCGGPGRLVEGSPDVWIGDSPPRPTRPPGLGNRLRVALLDHDGRCVPNIDFVVDGPTTLRGTTGSAPIAFDDIPPGNYRVRFLGPARVHPEPLPPDHG